MSTSSESLALLGRAAELRAAGNPWPDAATKLSVGHDELRRLVAEHTRDYDKLARRARADLLRETLDEAVAALRVMLKSPDERLGFMAATTLVRFELARMRHGTKAARERLERDISPRGRRRLTAEFENVRDEMMSESPEVMGRHDVAAPEKVAQSAPRHTPPSPVRAKPATQAKPAVATSSAIPPDELMRRRGVLLNDFVRGYIPAPPLSRDDRVSDEVARFVDGMLTDAPPG